MANNKEERLARIIEICLARVESGQETIDSVLGYYPDMAAELRPTLEAAAWLSSARQALEPSPAFVRASQQRLINRIQHEIAVQNRPQAVAPTKFWEWWIPARRHVFQFALALILLLVLIFSGETVVLAARGSIPGDVLYPVKLAQEKAQLALSFTEAGDTRLQIHIANQRLMEIEGLIVEGRFNRIPTAVAAYEDQIDEAVFTLQETMKRDPAQGLLLASQLQQVLTDRTQEVSVLATSLPPSARVPVDQALQITEESAETVQTLVSENGGQQPPVSPTLTLPALATSPAPGVVPSETAVTTQALAPASVTPTSPFTATPQATMTNTQQATNTPTASKTPTPATLTPTTSATRSIFRAPPTATNTPAPQRRPTARPTRERPKPSKTPKPPPNPTRRPPKPD